MTEKRLGAVPSVSIAISLAITLSIVLSGPALFAAPGTSAPQEPSACEKLVIENYQMRAKGDYQAAEKALQDAQKIAASDFDKMRVFNAFGGLYMHTDRNDAAEKYLRDAMKLGEKIFKPDSVEMGSLLDNLSVVCSSNKKYTEAETFNGKAIEIYKKQGDSQQSHIDLVTVLGNRGFILGNQKKWAESEKSFEEAVDLCKSTRSVPPDLYATMLDNLGGTYSLQGKLDKSEQVRVDALALFESAQGQNHPETIKAKRNLAFVYAQQGKLEDAAKLLKSAIEGLKGTGTVNKELLMGCLSDLKQVGDLMEKQSKNPPAKSQ